MKLLASAAALGCLAVLGLAAGPALSLERWRPDPVDFELAPRGEAYVGASSRRGFVSRPLRAGKRFNLVGLRWRGRAEPKVALRTRRSGGRWSRWLPLASHAEDGPDPGSREPAVQGLSLPAWIGEADEVQYRLSRRVAGLRLHFVNVQGTATRADRARTALRRLANSAVVSAASVLGAPRARAAEAKPSILPRAAWGAADCPPRSPAEYGAVKAAVVHHTVSANDYTAEETPAVILAICRYHRNSNGWNDIGYNFLVDRFGRIWEGRAGGVDRPVAGAQVAGFNFQTTGIANLGDFRDVGQTPQALQAMARLIRWKLPVSGAPTAGPVTLTSSSGKSVPAQRVIGHRDLNSTTCPGDALYAQLPALRAQVGFLAGTARPMLDAVLSRVSVRYKGRARVRGVLRDANGVPLGGKTVLIQVRRADGSWRTVATVSTARDGAYSALLRPRGNRSVRARFDGAAGIPASASPTLLLKVRPIVKLSRAPKAASAGVRVKLRGTVKPRKRRVLQVLQQRRRGVWRTVGRRRLRARRGRFVGSFVPRDRGSYRYYVVAGADAKTAKGRSPRAKIRIRG